MIEYKCPKHNCITRNGVCTEFDIDPDTGKKVQCTVAPVMSSSVYWCEECGVPIFYPKCNICGKDASYIATDIRPVFPEEKLLLAVLLKKDNPLCFEDCSVWNTANYYIVDGDKIKVSIKDYNSMFLEDVAKVRERVEEYSGKLDYSKFESIINKFIDANSQRYDEITTEAISYIQGYTDKYTYEDMFVSFSGGKDSTVVSSLVEDSFPGKNVVRIFGDTTLEFPLTYEYRKRYAKEHRGIFNIVRAKNHEKNFEELCKQIGPPSRVMRWCCTVFKTGAITKTLESVFKDRTNILSFQGIRRSESASRSKYERESESPKITKQTVALPIVDWLDFDVWLYILTKKIDFNEAYRLGYSRVGCWCCPNNGGWSEFLSKVYMPEQYENWRNLLIDFAKSIGKPDAEDYVDGGFWKARQGGNGLEIAQKSIVTFEPCATEDNAFNYDLQRPITDELYELFKPFGYINKDLGNKRLGEVYVMNKKGEVVLVLKGRIGQTKLKVMIKKINIAKARSLSVAEGKIQCQLTKYQMCLGCKACESVCKHGAISIHEDSNGNIEYKIDDEKCVRCAECVSHFNAGCYMRKVLTIRRS
ncbi:phosphoadenosine phosphosulfate reductase family protein [Eubacterium xylanophilum]|uniref:phosphoadenosine phosphosulfate reductase domain-containing protein n=1 Tax=Eubacterium xylanophilum TaxID=39497 RepID=UPI00047EBA01|nr:phosphoadenosine phosphosulfate reductase family protein [Eubacterium xylanophilum]